jgi:hypothetical protein
MEIIYVYTTDTYKSKNWFKIGETTQESGSVRIRQQDGTSNPERLEKQYEIDISEKTESSAYEVEQKIHTVIKVMKYKVRWINKKIDLVDRKISENNIINYDEDYTLPHDWMMYDLHQRNIFIKENLNDSSNIEFI